MDEKKQIVYFAILLLFLSVACAFAFVFITPDFAAKYLTIDGEIDENKIGYLNRLRLVSLITAIILFICSCVVFFLSRKVTHPLSVSIQRWVKWVLSFDASVELSVAWKKIDSGDKRLFLINLFVIILSHGFLLNNIIINWDGQGGLDFSSIANIPSGRWFTVFLGMFTENHYLPVPFFIVSALLMAASGVLFANFWDTNFLNKVVISSSFLAFPSFAAGFAYNFFSTVYPLASLLSLLSIRFVLRPGRKNLYKAFIFFIFMLATYQGFINFAFALMLVIFLINLLEEKKDQTFLLKRFILLGLGAPIFYKLTSDLILYLIGMDYYDYRGADQIGPGYIIAHVPENFTGTYKSMRNFLSGVYFSMPFYLLACMLTLLGLGVVTLMARLYSKPRSKTSLVIAGMLLALSPPLIYATQFLNTYIDTLLVFGMVPIIAGAYYVVNEYAIKLMHNFGLLLLGLILIGFINRSNGIHLKNYLWTQTTLRLATDIAIKIGELPDFKPGMKLVRIGNLSTEKFPVNRQAPFSEQGMTMVSPTGLSTWGEARTLNGVMNYLGFHYQTATLARVPKAIRNRVKDMPVYPEPGSLMIIDDYLLIKLSD